MKHKRSGVESEIEPRRSHLSTFRKAAASVALLASAASLAGAGSRSHADALSQHDGPVVVNTSAPTESQPREVFPYHPTVMEVTKSDPEYCRIVDVSMPQQFDYREILAGAQTEFAVSAERYHELNEALEHATTVAEMQNILKPVIEGLGSTVEFDDSHASESAREQRTMGTTLEKRYRHSSQAILQGLTMVPREMLTYVRGFKLSAADWVIVDTPDGPEKHAGLYYPTDRRIELPMIGLLNETVIHEIAHSIHRKSCEGRNDSELKHEYERAFELYKQIRSPKHSKLVDGERVGFPTEYSLKNHRELFAELTVDLIAKGGYITDKNATKEQLESARELREMVVARLQKAMPDVDIDAYLQYMNAFKELPPYVASPREVVENQLSVYDETYSLSRGDQASLSPAIILRSPGAPEQVVYAYTIRGKGYETVDVHLRFVAGTSQDTKAILTQAVKEYLENLPIEGHKDLMISSDPSSDGLEGAQLTLQAQAG